MTSRRSPAAPPAAIPTAAGLRSPESQSDQVGIMVPAFLLCIISFPKAVSHFSGSQSQWLKTAEHGGDVHDISAKAVRVSWACDVAAWIFSCRSGGRSGAGRFQ